MVGWRRVLAILMIALMGLPLLQSVGAHAALVPPVPGNKPDATYVALGDSYASGEGVGPFFKGTEYESGDDQGCHRSVKSYPSLVQQSLSGIKVKGSYELLGGGSGFAHVACSGAVTTDLYSDAAGNQIWDEPIDRAQLSYLGSNTKYVTVTIGGNDAGFGELLQECAVWAQRIDRTTSVVVNAMSILDGNARSQDESHCASKLSEFESARLGDLRQKLGALYHEILVRAPNAQVVVTNYPRLLRPTFEGKWVADTHLCAISRVRIVGGRVGFLAENVDGLNSYQVQLNQRISGAFDDVRAVHGSRIKLVDVYSATTNNGISCGDKGVTDYVSALRLQFNPPKGKFVGRSTASFHPNKAGQAFFANMVLPVLHNPLTYSGGEWQLNGLVGEPLAGSRFLTGGLGELTTAIEGDAPDWLSVNTVDREVAVSGTPAASGAHSFTVRVSDERGDSTAIPISLVVADPNDVGGPAPLPENAQFTVLWPAPDGRYLARYLDPSTGNSYLVWMFEPDGSSIRINGQVVDVTFGPDSTAYIALLSSAADGHGRLLRLPPDSDTPEPIYQWDHDFSPFLGERFPYSVEYVDGALFVEALRANVIFSCQTRLDKVSLDGTFLDSLNGPTSCGGVWDSSPAGLSVIDFESFRVRYFDATTLDETASVPFPAGQVSAFSMGGDGSYGLKSGSCDGAVISRVDGAGVRWTLPMEALFPAASTIGCQFRDLVSLSDGRVAVAIADSEARLRVTIIDQAGLPSALSLPAAVESAGGGVLAADGDGKLVVAVNEAYVCPTFPDPFRCSRVLVTVFEGTSSQFLAVSAGSNYVTINALFVNDGSVAAFTSHSDAFCCSAIRTVLDRVPAPVARHRWHNPATADTTA